jgi:chemotaxis protein CheC
MTYTATDIQQSALKELGNIGAGHAASALADLMGLTVGLTEPSVNSVPVEVVTDVVSRESREVAMLHMEIYGDAPAEMVIVFDRSEAIQFVRRFLEKQVATKEINDDLIDSSLREIANIIGGSYLTAIVDMIGIDLLPSTPRLKYGKLDALLKETVDPSEGRESFMISNGFINERGAMNAEFFLIPYDASLGAYLEAFGLGA